MMKMTFSRLAFAAALSFGVALPAAAQQQHEGHRQEQGQGRRQRQDPRQRLEQRVAQLTQRLRLNQGQATQIRRILEQEQQRFAQFRGSRDGQRQGQDRARQGGDDGQRRQGFEQMRALRQQTEQQIERVLNRTQLAEYRQMREQRGRGQRGEGRQGQGRQQGQGWSGR